MEYDPFPLVYEDIAQQVRAMQAASSSPGSPMRHDGAEGEERRLRRKLSDIEGAREDLAMLHATIDIVNANRERFPDVSNLDVAERQAKVGRLNETLHTLRAATDARLKQPKSISQSIELQDLKKGRSSPIKAPYFRRNQDAWLSISAREALLDEKLGTLEQVLDRLETQALSINENIVGIGGEVEGLDAEVDFSRGRLNTAQKRVGQLLKTNSKREIRAVIVLSIIFCVLFLILIL
eukprot:GEMP01079086.1.p1 GENE.GEMP01079086.1~~GEMP01079086.1.p1  ORF type:complete len:237 (+),score=61.30 GEMP01079086.1:210-920(+)